MTETKVMETYRVIQILTQLFNDVWRNPSMSALVWGAVISEAGSLYFIITSVNHVPFFMILLFSSQAIDFFITIHVLFKLASFPCTKSCDFLESMKRRNNSRWGKMNYKWMKRFLKSCPPSKLSMGNGQCFEQLTSFVIWDTCINILITLLLL
jgi:hypothetical protein